MLLSERPVDKDKRNKAEIIILSLIEGFRLNKFKKYDLTKEGFGWVWVVELAYPNLCLRFDIGSNSLKLEFETIDDKRIYILYIGCHKSYSKNIKTPYEIIEDMEDKIIHEIIHLLTLEEMPKRRYFKKQNIENNRAGYINSDLEWEAYFQQVAYYFDGIVSGIKYRNNNVEARLQTFKDKVAETPRDFTISFWWRFQGITYGSLYDVIDDAYKKKWEKRIYQLYNEYIEFLSDVSNKNETINRVIGNTMKSNLQVHLESRLKTILEAEGDEKPAEDSAPAPEVDNADDEDFFSQEEVDAAKGGADAAAPEGEESPQEEPEGNEEPASDEDPEDQAGPGMAGAGSGVSDDEKMRQLFTDSGDPEVDFGLTSEANVRLAKFKFKNANIDPLTMMDESELAEGVRVDELESRLTPDQYDLYRSKWKEIRHDFPKIAEREQKVVIYNSNVPFFFNDESGNTVAVDHKRDVNTAIDKLNKYMIRNFTEDWVDNKKAVKFLQGVRINFSEEPKIRPNLISAKFFEEYEDRDLVPFNKLHADIPESVRKFLKDNLEMDAFKKSSVFRTLSNDYVGENSGSSRTSVYAVIKGDEGAAGVEGDTGKDPAAGDEEDMGDIGGDTGDAEADTEAPDEGEDAGGDEGADTGEEDLGL